MSEQLPPLSESSSGAPLVAEIFTSPTQPHPLRVGQIVVSAGGARKVVYQTCPDGFSPTFSVIRPESWADGFCASGVTTHGADFVHQGAIGSTEYVDTITPTDQVLTPRQLAAVQMGANNLEGYNQKDPEDKGRAKLFTLMVVEQCIADRIARGEPVSEYARSIDSGRQDRVVTHDREGYQRLDYTQFAELDTERLFAAASGDDI